MREAEKVLSIVVGVLVGGWLLYAVLFSLFFKG